MRELGITYTAAERRALGAARAAQNGITITLDASQVLITTSALQTSRGRLRSFAGPAYPVRTPIHDEVLAKLHPTNQEH
jgi:hypothetical protein